MDIINTVSMQIENISTLISEEHDNISFLLDSFRLDVASCGHVENASPSEESVILRAHELQRGHYYSKLNLRITMISERLDALYVIYDALVRVYHHIVDNPLTLVKKGSSKE